MSMLVARINGATTLHQWRHNVARLWRKPHWPRGLCNTRCSPRRHSCQLPLVAMITAEILPGIHTDALAFALQEFRAQSRRQPFFSPSGTQADPVPVA